MSDIEQCAIADLISQVNDLEQKLLEAKAKHLQLSIENFHILKIEQQLLEADAKIERLTEALRVACIRMYPDDRWESLVCIGEESPTQSLALHDAELLERMADTIEEIDGGANGGSRFLYAEAVRLRNSVKGKTR